MENSEAFEKAKKIGSREAYLGVGIALGIDLVVIVASSLDSQPGWIWQNGAYWKFGIFALQMLFWGQVFGKKCADSIIIKRKPFGLTGIFYTFATVLLSAFLAGVVAFLIDSWNCGSIAEMAYMYMLVPGLLIVLYTGIPILVHGIVFGYRINKKGNKI